MVSPTRIRAVAAVAAVVTRAGAPGLLARTLAAHLAFAFGVVQLDAVVDWGAVAHQIAGLGRPTSGLLLLGAVGLWAFELRRALQLPAFVHALGLSHAERGAVAAALALTASAPMAVLAWLWPGPGITLGAALWAALLAWAPWTLPLALIGFALGGPAPLLLAPLALPAVGRALSDGRAAAPQGRGLGARLVRGPIGALVRRDLLAVTRLAPGAALGLLLQSVPAFGAERAFAVNGAPDADLLAAGVLVALASTSVAAALGQASVALGPRFDPPAWPLTSWQRAGALGASAALGLAPTGLALALASPRATAVTLGTSLAAVAGIAWSIAADRRGIDGRYLWWAVLLGLVALRAPAATPVLAVVAGLGAVRAIHKGRP